jgi:hypothetical protein
LSDFNKTSIFKKDFEKSAYFKFHDKKVIFVVKGRPRRRWEDNIKMDVQEVGGGRGDCMQLAQVRDRWRALVSTVKKLRVP